MAYNKQHGITPKTIEKDIRAVIEATMVAEETADYTVERPVLSAKEREKPDSHTGEGNENGSKAAGIRAGCAAA